MKMTAHKIMPCLWFDTQAEAAANHQMRKIDIAALQQAAAA